MGSRAHVKSKTIWMDNVLSQQQVAQNIGKAVYNRRQNVQLLKQFWTQMQGVVLDNRKHPGYMQLPIDFNL